MFPVLKGIRRVSFFHKTCLRHVLRQPWVDEQGCFSVKKKLQRISISEILHRYLHAFTHLCYGWPAVRYFEGAENKKLHERPSDGTSQRTHLSLGLLIPAIVSCASGSGSKDRCSHGVCAICQEVLHSIRPTNPLTIKHAGVCIFRAPPVLKGIEI